MEFLTEDFYTMAIRLGIAALLSGFIGLERENRNQPAGLRTHLLVGVSACLMMLLSLYGFNPYEGEVDLARIPSYVLGGIGFLGAGVIMTKGLEVRGLTTAASIWIVACLGLVIGAGMYAIGILTTLIVLFSLYVLKKITDHRGDGK